MLDSTPGRCVSLGLVVSDESSGLETTRLDASDVAQRIGASDARVFLLLSHRWGVETAELTSLKSVVVGREPPSDVALSDPSLSRRHARFVLSGSTVVVEDLDSTNGTWWQGRRVERQELGAGDEVLLGTVVASVQIVSDQAARIGGLDRHETFRRALEAEATRAAFFRRGFSLVMMRSEDKTHVRHWFAQIRGLLRPVDGVALYSHDTVEVLMPEAGLPEAEALARQLVASTPAHRLLAGVAVYPDSATSGEELVEMARRAAYAASANQRVCAAPVASARTWTPGASPDRAPIVVSDSMRELLRTAGRLARGVIPVLLVGETGVGKEVVARVIHESGPRREAPMVCVNCAAIPSTLIESTLFGHERGAFTGAVGQHRGVFERADGGTVLLDEIGELPPGAQAALLRVLETKRVTRVGSNRETAVDVRVLAATHRDLAAMCEQGGFRSDLLYRLNAMTLRLPPLRERKDDIAPLVARFLEEANAANQSAVTSIEDEAMQLLHAHAWPGNVRELRNAIERAVVIAEGDTVTVEDLPETLREAADDEDVGDAADAPLDFRSRMDRLEAELLTDALRACDWNQRVTAQRLQMPLRTLVHKIKVHGIKRPPRGG